MQKRKKQLVRPKRPKDPYQLAHALVEKSTREEKPPSKADISRVMSELGRRGGKKGGKMRLQTLTADRRREIALQAAKARWEKKKPETAKQPLAFPSTRGLQTLSARRLKTTRQRLR